jgi:uncharacterized membrane protein
VRLFPWQKSKKVFNKEETNLILDAIRDAEKRTSGEIRVFIESRCRFVDPIDRARELFYKLKMDKTELQNAVILYIALKDHQLAVYGDEGIHQKVGTAYWQNEVEMMMVAFSAEEMAKGISECVKDIGEALHMHFPFDSNTDRNELPDDIVFGKI